MHQECATFIAGCAEVGWADALVYEVGAYNVNGRVRDIVPQTFREWVGFDLLAGPDVQHVGDAVDTLPGLPGCDVMVSAEVLEHYDGWDTLVAVMCDAVKPDGWVLITCAGRGRAPHSANGGPLMDGEHYRNVELGELADLCAAHGVVKVYGEEGFPGDTRFLGRKVSDG